MAVKRQSAFNRALREAQEPEPAQTIEQPAPVPAPVKVQPPPVEASLNSFVGQPAPVVTAPVLAKPPTDQTAVLHREPNRGGRPRNPVAKKKFTYYLPDESDANIVSIKKAMVRYADTLVDDKGEVVEQALGVMLFALEDAGSRQAFLEIYRHWLATRPS